MKTKIDVRRHRILFWMKSYIFFFLSKSSRRGLFFLAFFLFWVRSLPLRVNHRRISCSGDKPRMPPQSQTFPPTPTRPHRAERLPNAAERRAAEAEAAAPMRPCCVGVSSSVALAPPPPPPTGFGSPPHRVHRTHTYIRCFSSIRKPFESGRC